MKKSPSKIIQICHSVNRNCLYALTNEGEIFHYKNDINSEGTDEWSKLPSLPKDAPTISKKSFYYRKHLLIEKKIPSELLNLLYDKKSDHNMFYDFIKNPHATGYTRDVLNLLLRYQELGHISLEIFVKCIRWVIDQNPSAISDHSNPVTIKVVKLMRP